jgi:hypothetical protein
MDFTDMLVLSIHTKEPVMYVIDRTASELAHQWDQLEWSSVQTSFELLCVFRYLSCHPLLLKLTRVKFLILLLDICFISAKRA